MLASMILWIQLMLIRFFHLFFLFTKIVRLSPVIFGQIHEINN